MTITITIDCDTAAFENNHGAEVARILRTFATDQLDLDRVIDGMPLRDGNGNTCGHVRVEE